MSGETAPQLPCSAVDLVPHEPPMLLVERVIWVANSEDPDGWSIVEAHAPEDGIFVADGGVLPEYLIELAAQAIAAVDGYENLRCALGPSVGFLVGVQDFIWQAEILTGMALRIELNKSFSFGNMKIFTALVYASDKLVCRGEIKLWKDETR
ncbi:MAG: hypothetical protein OEM02_06305 [Desulfobulbaceae bacterium]|nr:hypothetical protein [Desulfobulbaceae bacterium]